MIRQPRRSNEGFMDAIERYVLGVKPDRVFLLGLALTQVFVLSLWMLYMSLLPACPDTSAVKTPNDYIKLPELPDPPAEGAGEEDAVTALTRLIRELKDKKEWDAAMDVVNEALANEQKDNPVIVAEKAGIFYDKDDWNKAAQWFRKAHKLAPDNPVYTQNAEVAESMKKQEIDLLVKEAQVLKGDKEWDKALAMLMAYLPKYNDSDTLLAHIGGWYFDKEQHREAADWYKKAYDANPEYPYHAINAANCLDKARLTAEAARWMRKALDRDPTNKQYKVNLIKLMMKANDWTDFDRILGEVLDDMGEQIRNNERVFLDPFTALHMPIHPNDIEYISAQFANDLYKQLNWRRIEELRPLKNASSFKPGDKIKVGYLSYDFRMHPVGLATQTIFEKHDRTKFEIFAYDVFDRNGQTDVVYETIKGWVDHMIELPPSMKPEDAIERIREDNVDILVDLTLFTAGQRMNLFMGRSAPIQMGGVGLATTSGCNDYDYLLVDKFVVTPEHREYYDESMLRLPHSYHPWAHAFFYHDHPDPNFKRSMLNPVLPEGKILYCNPANAMRQKPEVMKRWVEIIHRVPNSVLVMKYFQPDIAENLQRDAQELGLKYTEDEDSEMMWMHGTGGKEHITWKSMCDVYLDTPYYNGHSTTADMLFAGVPMVTLAGETIASRAAGSFAASVGVPEMSTDTWEEYVELAVRLGTDEELRLEWRRIINEGRFTNGLFDITKWVRGIENGFEQAVALWREGKPNKDITCVIDE